MNGDHKTQDLSIAVLQRSVGPRSTDGMCLESEANDSGWVKEMSKSTKWIQVELGEEHLKHSKHNCRFWCEKKAGFDPAYLTKICADVFETGVEASIVGDR